MAAAHDPLLRTDSMTSPLTTTPPVVIPVSHTGSQDEPRMDQTQGQNQSTTTTTSQNSVTSNEKTDNSGRRKSSHRPITLARLKSAFSPSTHDVLVPLDTHPDTSRPYIHRRQRWRMWRLTIGEFVLTVLLCLAYFLILYLYSKQDAINTLQRHIFNSLTTGTTLLLGVNLAASLRSYAKMLRWRILATTYWPLQQFDLIMGCDSVSNVLKLFLCSKWFSATQFFCVLWIIVQLGCAVAVSIIGLTYNLDVSTQVVFLQTGNTSVINFDTLLSNNYPFSLSSTQEWGIKGDGSVSVNGSISSDQPAFGFLTVEQGTTAETRYFFSDQNPNLAANGAVSSDITSRYIDSVVSCTAYEVLEGQYGNLTYIVYNDNGVHVNETLFQSPGSSGLYVTANTNSTCGPRCTNITTFQAASVGDDPTLDGDLTGFYYFISTAVRFQCNSTVSQVLDIYAGETSQEYQTSDVIARMLAGMYGWSDQPLVHGDIGYTTYTNSSEIGYTSTPSAADMAGSISAFTMGGIAFMDTSQGLPRKFIADGNQPIQAQVLSVKWWAAGLLLALIPFVHFCTLGIVIACANRAIIKDDAYLSIAKAYHSLLDKLGDHGCILNGKELAASLHNPKVAWGWTLGTTDIQHADIFPEDSSVVIERSFHEGVYDGRGYQQGEMHVKKRTSREIDAYVYF